MAHYGPLGGASATVEAENMDEAVVAAELERAFGENPATSNGEKRAVSPDDQDIPGEGAPDHEELCTYYFRSSTITVGIIMRKITSRRTRLTHPGPKPCRSQTMMKLWCMKISCRRFVHASASGPG
jgi:hypothetical protein